MRNTLKKLIFSTIIAVCVLNISSIHGTERNLRTVNAEAVTNACGYEWGTVNATTLNVRKSASASSTRLTTLKKGKRVKCRTLKTAWVKITVGNYTGYVSGKYITTAYGTATSPYANIKAGKVNATSLVIRKSASTSAAAVTTAKKNAAIQALTTGTTWVKVKVNGKTGYAKGCYITLNCGGTASSPGSSKGQQVITYAKKFLGTRYVYGGSSLTGGTDCSGFTMRVYQHFGYTIPRTSTLQRSCGKKVASLSQAQPGDLICYSGHVALYMGNNQIIHATTPCVKISTNASYRSILAIRRVI